MRTRWLTARVAAGLGRTGEAIAIVAGVCEGFRALRLFCEAARREAATVELAQRAQAEVRQVGRRPT